MGAHKKPLSRCEIVGGVVEVEIINSNEKAICDIEDYGFVSAHRWRKNNSGYAMTYMNRTGVFMHRHIMSCPRGYEVDHVNHNKFDNRRANLRIVTRKQNALNLTVRKDSKSGVRGVRKHGKKWQAYIMLNRKMYLLGTHETIEDARRAREEAEKIYHKPILDAAIRI